MHEVKYDYSSAQVMIPTDLAWEIMTWGDDNIPDASLHIDPTDPSFGRENEMHVTVLYGLRTDDPTPVKRALRGVSPFECVLGSVSLFVKNRYFDVLKIDVDSPDMHTLHRRLKRLPHCPGYPVYCPHITIAYVRKGLADCCCGSRIFKGRSFKVNDVVFSTRSGAKITLPLANGEGDKGNARSAAGSALPKARIQARASVIARALGQRETPSG